MKLAHMLSLTRMPAALAVLALLLAAALPAAAGTIPTASISVPIADEVQTIGVGEQATVTVQLVLGTNEASIGEMSFQLTGLGSAASASVAIGGTWSGFGNIPSDVAILSLTSNPLAGTRDLATFTVTGLAPGVFTISLLPDPIVRVERFDPTFHLEDIAIDPVSNPLATVTVLPEPATLLLLGLGLAGLAFARR